MKKVVFGLLASGFIALSSFTTVSTSNNDKFDETVAYYCCTARNASNTQSVTVCGDGNNNCQKARELYAVIF